MFKISLPRFAFLAFLIGTLSIPGFAQLCGGIYGPCPPATTTSTPTPAPAAMPSTSPTPAPATSTSTAPVPTASPAPATTTLAPAATPATGSAAATVSTKPVTPAVTTTAPGTSQSILSSVYGNKSYSEGKTIAYIIAPFAVVAGTYFLGHHHQIEINPNAGFFWPGKGGDLHLRDEGMYSLKALASLTDNFQVEGNFAYMNHLESRFAPRPLDQSFGITPQTVHGLIYDINGLYNFGEHPLLGSGVNPYVVAGVGGLSTLLENGGTALIGGQIYVTNPATGAAVLAPSRTVIVADNSAFFSVNYGVGVKAPKLWGPMGVRVDVRGRTFPNFRGQTITW